VAGVERQGSGPSESHASVHSADTEHRLKKIRVRVISVRSFVKIARVGGGCTTSFRRNNGRVY
jgi:hypothetical protein